MPALLGVGAIVASAEAPRWSGAASMSADRQDGVIFSQPLGGDPTALAPFGHEETVTPCKSLRQMLCRRPRYNQRVFPDSLTLTRQGGVEGDFEMSMPWLKLDDGSPDPRIQVSILPLRVLDLVWRNRGEVVHPGDPIVADLDTSEANLPVGTLLRVGTAVLRVSDLENDGCAKWRVRYGRPALTWVAAPANRVYRLRGIFCSIEQDGVVRLRDTIKVLGGNKIQRSN